MFFVLFFVLLVHFFCFPCSNFSSTFVFAYWPHFPSLYLFFILFFLRPFSLSCLSLSLSLSLSFPFPLILSLIQQSSAISNFSASVRPMLVLNVDYSKPFRTSVRPLCKCCHSASDWAATASLQILYTLIFTLSVTRR